MTVSLLRPALAAALLGLNLGAIAAPAPAPITFDTTPRAGQQHRQLIDMQAVMKMRIEPTAEATDAQRAQLAQAAERMNQMGAMKMSMQMLQTLKVDQPDADGWLPMTVATGSRTGKLEVGGKVVPLPNPKGGDLAFVARFNPRDFAFEFQKVEGSAELSEAMRTQGAAAVGEALQLFKALRERPLKVGDSVDVPLTMTLPVPLPGGAGSMNGQLHYTLARVDHGVAYFDLSMDLKLDIDAPVPTPGTPATPATAASAPQGDAASAAAAASAPATGGAEPKTMHLLINGSGKGSSALRLADRLPLSNQLTMDMQVTMNMPDNARMFMDMTLVTKSKGESLAKPAAAKAEPKKKL